MAAVCALLLLLPAVPAYGGDPGAAGDLYVSSGGNDDTVVQFDGQTGELVGAFLASGSGGLDNPQGLAFGPNGNLFVAGYLTQGVIEYDGIDGTLIGTFATGGGLGYPAGLTFGLNGNLFVAGNDTDNVIEYDGTTGAPIGTFASGGGLNSPTDLTFGPNGNLFVSSSRSDRVIEYDGATGALIGTFASGGGLDWPNGLTFGPNGNLFVGSYYSDSVIEYDGGTGALIGTFAIGGGLGLTFGPDGNLFVVDGGRVIKYDGATGTPVGSFTDAIIAPSYLTFKPLTGPFPEPNPTGLAPAQADNCGGLMGATVTGTGLVWGVQLRLTRAGESDRIGAVSDITPDTSITANFNLTGAAVGLWDLLLTYPDDQTGTLVDALEIATQCPPPTVTDISPGQVVNCEELTGAIITGTGFVTVPPAGVHLSMAGQEDIVGTNVDVQSSTTIVADLDTWGAALGLWDVVVTNPDGQAAVLPGGLEVSQCAPPIVTSLNPNAAMTDSTITVGVFGSNFAPSSPPPTVTLHQDGVADISAQATNCDSPLHVTFGLQGAPLGMYDVTVTRGDGESGTLPAAFQIVANPGLRLKQIGAWGGTVDAIDIHQFGDQRIAYIGSGVRLVILDVTDPGNIIELSSLMLDAVILDLEVRDGYAYIGALAAFGHPSASPGAWFCVVDVHDVTAPFLVAGGIGQNGCGGNFMSVALDGSGRTAYVTPWQSAPQAIDITDPTAPVYLGECGGACAPVFSGDLLYGLNPDDGNVSVSDMSALPESCPGTRLGTVHIPEYAGATISSTSALAGDYLYVIAHLGFGDTRHSLLFVVDFSDLEAPVHVGTWGDPSGETLDLSLGTRGAVAVSDGRLYWAGWGRDDPLSRTMVILDVATDPANPQLIGEYSSAAEFGEIKVIGTTVYLGDWREGLTILDCSDPANPLRVGNYFSPRDFNQAALEGNMLYITDPSYGVSIVDVSDSQAPALVGQWETGTYNESRHRMDNWGIAARDGQAYVAAGYAGFQVLDVSNPSAPALAGEFSPWPEGAVSVGLTVSPDEPIVHVGVVPGAWIVNFDVSNPSNIVDVGSVNIGGLWAKPLTIDRRSDGIAYVARGGDLVTVDLAIADAPLFLGEMGYAALTLDLAVDGDVLYAVNDSPSEAELGVFSVAAPDHLPVHLAHYDFGSTNPMGFAVAVSNGRAYVAAPPLDLSVLDVSTPASPVLLARTPAAGARINDLIVDGPTVYAITRDFGGEGGAGVLSYLVYVPGDMDDDGEIGPADAAAFASCFTGPDIAPSDATCLIGDFDGDNDIDCDDWEAFKLAWTAPGSPPSFGPCDCPEDLMPPPGVEQQDLNAVLNRWGDPACEDGGAAYPCPEDLALPDGVEQQDLNAVLNRWGDPTCEPIAPAPGSPTPGKPKDGKKPKDRPRK